MWGRQLLGYLPVNAAQAIVGFGSVYVLTRLLSPADYGLYALALAATHFGHVPVFTWLEAASARFYARAERRGRLADHFASMFAAFAPLAAGLALVAGLVLWLAPIPAEIRTLAAFTVAALLVRAAMKLFQETRRAAQDVIHYGLIESAYVLGAFGLGIALILGTPLGAAGPFAGLLIAGALCVAVEAPGMLSRARGGRVHARRVKSYARYGAPIALSLVMALIVSVSDRFMLAFLVDEAAAGVYAAGYGLADRTLDIIFIWVGMSAGPLAVALLEREGRESAQKMIGLQGETMVLLALPAAVGLALVAGPLAAVMTGEAFAAEAARVIPWIAAGGFLAGFTTYYLDQSYELARKTQYIPLVLAVPAVINIGLNLALIPSMGIMGAVVATVAAYAAGAALTLYAGRRLFPLPIPVSAFIRAGAACGVMAVVVLALPELGAAWATLIVHAGLGGVAYLIAVLVFDAGPSRGAAAYLRDRLVRRAVPEPAR